MGGWIVYICLDSVYIRKGVVNLSTVQCSQFDLGRHSQLTIGIRMTTLTTYGWVGGVVILTPGVLRGVQYGVGSSTYG